MSYSMKVVLGCVAGMLISIILAGCCRSDATKPSPPPDRFEILSDQYMHSERHSNFSIMVIKDKKTEKEFRVVYNGQ